MTEKRFYLNEGEVGILKILDLKEDNEAIYHTASKSDMKMVVELFNRLSEENEQLKQFKQLVFNLIDKSLEKDKEDYEMTYEDYLNGRIEVLEDLKKELSE